MIWKKEDLHEIWSMPDMCYKRPEKHILERYALCELQEEQDIW